MEVFDEERKKLAIIKQQYFDLISYYNERIANVTKNYKHDAYMQANLLEQYTNKLQMLKRTINTPFFGRIDFLHDRDTHDTVCYIGKVGVLDNNGNPITVDWRAPIATLYYDANIGRAEYEVLDEIITGNLKLKRQFTIEDGKLVAIQDVDTVANDELLKPYLNVSADNRLKNIVATIQSEQNAIIRKSLYKNYIIQGTAGSGKTTVALHRISYLIYNEQKNFRENQFMVIGPNAYFMDYISSVLPDLDVQAVKEVTFLDIVNEYLGEKIKIIDQNARLERILNGEEIPESIPFKSSLAYKEALDKFICKLEDNMVHGAIKWRGITLIKEDDLRKFMAKNTLGIYERIKEFLKYAKEKIKKRKTDIEEAYWLKYRDIYLELAEDDPKRKEILAKSVSFNEDITKNIDKILKNYFSNYNLKPLALYKLFIENIHEYVLDAKDLFHFQQDTLKGIAKKTLGYEDLPALLYLNLKFYGHKGLDNYVHVVIDEAQDYGLFHFEVLKELFKNSTFSIFGDLAQSIYAYQSIHDWQEVINQVFLGEASLLNLKKSYRTTYEIMEAANLVSKWFGFGDAKAVLRHGNNPFVYQINDSNIASIILKRTKELLAKGYKSIAIIGRDEVAVEALAKILAKHDITYHKISTKNTKYEGGICLVSSYLAKGLEFDAVIIYKVDDYDMNKKIDLKLLYVAMTRALHELDITYQNKLIYPLESLR